MHGHAARSDGLGRKSPPPQTKKICNTQLGFCDCIVSKMPSGIGFIDYVATTAATLEDLHYDTRSQPEKQTIDGARKTL